MGSQVREPQPSGGCDCAHDLDQVAKPLRQALDVIEGSTTDCEAGVTEWRRQAEAQMRTQRPRTARGERR